MNSGVINLVVSGPVPGSARGDAESATALLRELHARTILHVARPAVDDPTGGTEPFVTDADHPTGPGDFLETADHPTGPGDFLETADHPTGPGDFLETADQLSQLGRLGRKGVGGPLAELVVTGLFSATTVAALAQVAVAFLQRGAARRITFRDGRRTLTISAPTDETERMVAEWLGAPPTQSGVGSGAD